MYLDYSKWPNLLILRLRLGKGENRDQTYTIIGTTLEPLQAVGLGMG